MPPLDVHWVWHVHMLAPRAYARDIKAATVSTSTRLFNYKPQSVIALKAKRDATADLWNSRYPHEPFWPPNKSDYEDESSSSAGRNHVSKFSYDIVAAALRQKLFYYQVSLPHYRDSLFLASGVRRYKQYLELKRRHPSVFLVPCYDMDVVWHTHQLQAAAYAEDTASVLGGQVLDHDDSVNDRTEGSKLCNSQQITEKLWRDEFGEDFCQPGAMFRGLPPNGKLMPILPEHRLLLQGGRTFTLTVEKFRMAVLPSSSRWPKVLAKSPKLFLRIKLVRELGWKRQSSRRSWAGGEDTQ